MKFFLVVLLLASTKVTFAQDYPSTAMSVTSLTKWTWDLGVLGGGGTGLGYARDTQFIYAGGRMGLILTEDRGRGLLRGNFEWAVEMLPLYTVLTPHRAVYAASVRPAVLRWNFSSRKTVAPYVSMAGGLLLSTNNLPPGNTSRVNFTPEAALGANLLLKSGKALLMEAAYVHHSNAGLSPYNPGYNASLFFTIGYTWFRRRE